MVFGNLGDTSATASAFTRNPSTGEKRLYGEFLINAQGEDVVAGIRTPQEITEKARAETGSEKPSIGTGDAEGVRRAHRIYGALEKHYRDMQDLEFTVEQGKLWMLQTRAGSAPPRRRCASRSSSRTRSHHQGRGVTRVDPASLRPAPASDHRPQGGAQRDRDRPAGVAGRRFGRDRVLVGRGELLKTQGRKVILVRSRPARRTSTACTPRRASSPRARHDLARGRGGARHGQAVRLRAGAIRVDYAAGTCRRAA